MTIGIPKEIKAQENRVSALPSGVASFAEAGHTVYVETGAGLGSGFTDAEYTAAGAVILPGAKEVYEASGLIYKVKEPLEAEYPLLREGQVLFTYLHLAPDPAQTQALLNAKVIAVAYETVQLEDKSLPLLAPMSAIAGRMSVQVGATLLQKYNEGRGILLGGVPGVEPGHVVIVGGGVVGLNAAKMAVGLGARVTVLDISLERLAYISDILSSGAVTLMSNGYNIAKAAAEADLLIGAVLIPGGRAPKVVTRKMVESMRPGAVVVDIAIDQGGSVETVDRLTSHESPYYVEHGIVHYSVPNMPGAVPRTSTFALANATMPYALQIANKGVEAALRDNAALAKGLNIYKGAVTNQAVAEAQGLPYQAY
ncbi:MAG: alanine dehydrogenase [Oscillospiraceae bacterium]|jgi:alanine dehydrogenase|nr:alanine dehydrogenase [Oscillospiraceae bacterium]